MAPKYTNAENQARHRARLIEQMGIEAFRARENKRILDAKDRKRAIPKEPKQEQTQAPEQVKELKPIKKRIIPILKSKLSDSSIKQYTTFIKTFYKHYTGKDLSIENDNNDILNAIISIPHRYKNIKSDFSFLNDKDTFNDVVIRYKSQIGYLYSILSRIYGMTQIIKKLYPYVKKNQDKYETDRSEREIPDNVVNTVSFDVKDVVEKVQNANLDRTEMIMAYLGLLIPTRRFNDYRIVKIIKNIPTDKIDKSFNYYYNGTIYIYTQKNKKLDTIDVPDEVFKLINLDDEFMVGKYYEQGTFTSKFGAIMYKIYGMTINNTLMRILYSSYLRTLNLSGKAYEDKAKKMGHSLAQNLKYSYVKK